jgi:hypothetical protein
VQKHWHLHCFRIAGTASIGWASAELWTHDHGVLSCVAGFIFFLMALFTVVDMIE